MLREAISQGISNPYKLLKKVVDSPFKSLDMIRGNVVMPRNSDSELVHLFSNTDIPMDKVDKYLEELRNDTNIHNAHHKMSNTRGNTELLVPPRCVGLYILTRHHQPSRIVETGSYYGHSTTYILSALNKNDTGELHSFDAHPNEIGWYPDLPQDFELGYMIPEELKGRWALHNGDINNTLEEGLETIKEIDLFFHDSNHKESHKRFEFELAKKYLTSNGILASHDVGHGNPSDGNPASYAFVDIAEEIGSGIHSSRKFEPGDDGSSVFAFCYIK